MLDIGLTLTDLSFNDNSSEMLISEMQHSKQLQLAIQKVNQHFYSLVLKIEF